MARTHRIFHIPPAPETTAEISFAAGQPWLAPLAGYSDLPFRLLCREHGAFICETEMISAKGLVWQSPGTGSLLNSTREDSPLVVQLFGGEAQFMGEAILALRKAGYNLFDCNMGCPVRKVMRQKAGAALLADPGEGIAVAAAMLKAASQEGPDLPEKPAKVGFKLRLPPIMDTLWDLGRKLEDMGASWITLHPRTASQGYGGNARHEYTEQLAALVGIPVLASGDLLDAKSGHDILQATGAKACMYGRGALINPYIFFQHRALGDGLPEPRLTHAGLAAIIDRHIELTRHYGGEQRAFFKMRSIIPRYVKNLRGVQELRNKLGKCFSWESLQRAMGEFLDEAKDYKDMA